MSDTRTSSLRRNGLVGLLAMTMVCLLAAAPASAGFGIASFDGALTEADGSPTTQAGSHPYGLTTSIDFNRLTSPKWGEMPDESVKDVFVDAPVGFLGNPTVAPQCTDFDLSGGGLALNSVCPPDTQVGMVAVELNVFGSLQTQYRPLFNMVPPPGKPASFGFNIVGVVVHMYGRVRSDGDYGISLDVPNVNQTLAIVGTDVTFWGVPADKSHDFQRCNLPDQNTGICEGASGQPDGEPHEAGVPPAAFLTNTTNCSGGLPTTTARADSWLRPGVFDTRSYANHDDAEPPNPTPTDGCDRVPFSPSTSALPTTDAADSPTGLSYELEIPSTGIESPTGIAQANLKKASVTLPEGMTINPSIGEGLGVCTPGQYASETADSLEGEGCPNSAKIGTVKIATPLLDEEVSGALYIAKQNDNPFNSLLAMYLVTRVPDRGVVIKVAGKVTPNPKTGQLVTTFDDLPQLPFSKFTLSFREGQRSPLSTPKTCGTYAVKSELVPWSAADPSNPTAGEVQTRFSEFKVTSGVNDGACPGGGVAPFKPGLQAGTLNNNAGSYSPFNVRMTRNDGEQEITSFSAQLPKGLTGKLAGVPSCTDAQIAQAATKTGLQEAANPSCPPASQVGRTLVGAGVGSVLAYAPGKVFLAAPYKGSPLSIAAITSATVGPFDLGTVVVRSALRVDPTTAQVSVDSVGSDPIPHILQGIPLHIRDIRVYVDRPEFTLNPTSCDPFAVRTRLTGSGADFANPADDVAANVEQPFQAANCANLAFKPKLAFKLKGGTNRGDYPALSATLRARKGDANIARTAVTLPHSAFLAQEHIRTICTRVQFAAEACPAASVYGKAKAITPLLDEPLQGPVYLRSSSNPLPDLVADLGGRFDVVLSGRIDSVNEGIRNTFDVVPDAPVSKFTLSMQGGKKGLIVNSRNLCKGVNRAEVKMVGQNGKTSRTRPVVANSCKQKARKGKKSKSAKR